MKVAIGLGGLLIVIGSLLPWAILNDGVLQYFPVFTGLQLGHGLLTILAGAGILLLASDRVLPFASRSRRAAALVALLVLVALFPSFLDRAQTVPWMLMSAALVLGPSADAIRRMASRPGRATLLLVLLVFVDLVALAIGFALHDTEGDGRSFSSVGLGPILAVIGASIAAIAASRLEAASARSAMAGGA